MSEPRPAAVSFVGVRTSCCGQYARGYVRGDGTAEGACPRCGRKFSVFVPNADGGPQGIGAAGIGVSASRGNR